jgi:hypothetical protein
MVEPPTRIVVNLHSADPKDDGFPKFGKITNLVLSACIENETFIVSQTSGKVFVIEVSSGEPPPSSFINTGKVFVMDFIRIYKSVPPEGIEIVFSVSLFTPPLTPALSVKVIILDGADVTPSYDAPEKVVHDVASPSLSLPI